MNKKHLLTLGTLGAVTLVMVTPTTVSAFEGFGPHDGQKPLFLHENATNFSVLHPSHLTETNYL